MTGIKGLPRSPATDGSSCLKTKDAGPWTIVSQSIDWRLWLITNDGKSQDVSNLMDVVDKHQSALQNLAEDGLWPGEWMFVLNQ